MTAAPSTGHTRQSKGQTTRRLKLPKRPAAPAPTPSPKRLQSLADELRKREPNHTREQAFSKVYCDPANRELARAREG
jgi:hypothetical protein